jgi:uncharacterized membrane protein YdjX (TVP38/TMEM64 family)
MPDQMPENTAGASILLRGLLVIGAILGVVALLRHSGFEYGPEQLKAWVDSTVRERGLTGILLFVAAGALFTGVGLSRQVLAFVAGYAFGAAGGAAVSLLAEMAGVVLAFSFARYVARASVVSRYGGNIRRFDDYLRGNPFLMTVAVKLFPLSSNVVLNVLAGVSGVSLVPYLLGSAVGHAPQTLVFAMIAAGVATSDRLQSMLAVVLFIVSGLLGLHLYRRYRRDFHAESGSMPAPDTGPGPGLRSGERRPGNRPRGL